ncbi:phage tail protein [Nguyenibacter vanlangensis]|uniref:Phage tail protein n=1 Tax=Nguyenibacter vanlangensis TaxID=1216886 RepID=A0ABZ3D216_9PROT
MANYTTIKTNYGLSLETAAQAAGTQISLTQMAIGDGGGNPVTPNPSQTGLVREVFRVALNAIAQSTEDATQFTAEAIIPAESGGYTMREAGLFTSDGSLFAVANLPSVYKPSSSEGAFGQVVVTMTFKAANADDVSLYVDENVSVATRLWVENYVTPAHVFPGGQTAQVLAKKSNADGDWEWVDPSAAVQVLVDTIEEDQTLAAGQTVVNLNTVTTEGLAVFINGLRLEQNQWGKTSPTSLTLAQAGNDGDKITLVQNEQTGYSDVLRGKNNLSDVHDPVQSLANIGGLPLSGGSVSGTLAVDGGTFYVNGNAATNRQMLFQSSGLSRFAVCVDASVESGGNSGSELRISRFDDSGAFIDSPLMIDRPSGVVSMPSGIVAPQVAGPANNFNVLYGPGGSNKAGFQGDGNFVVYNGSVAELSVGLGTIIARLSAQFTSGITANSYLTRDDAAGTFRNIFLNSSGVNRWDFGANNSGETGNNAGSDFYITAHSDSGGYLSTPFWIPRASGQVQINLGMSINNGSVLNLTGNATLSSGNNQSIYWNSNNSWMTFEAGGHMSIWDKGNGLIFWTGGSDSTPNVNTNGAFYANKGAAIAGGATISSGYSSGTWLQIGPQQAGEVALGLFNAPAGYGANILQAGMNGQTFLSVQNDGGVIVPSGAYFQAQNANGVFVPQAAQFDNGYRAASTSFVRRALGSYSGIVAYASNTQLTNANVGQAVQWCGPSGGVMTLPTGSGVPAGGLITVFNQTPGTVTVAASGSDFLHSPTAQWGQLTLQAGDTMELTSRGNGEWDISGGTMALLFSSSLTTTPPAGDSSQRIPTTGWVTNGFLSLANGGIVSGHMAFNGIVDHYSDIHVNAGKWLYTDTITSNTPGSSVYFNTGISLNTGNIYGTSNFVNVNYGPSNAFAANFQNDGNFVLRHDGNPFFNIGTESLTAETSVPWTFSSSITVSGNINANGGLTAGGTATFNGEAGFNQSVYFDGPAGSVRLQNAPSDVPGSTGLNVPNTAWVDANYVSSTHYMASGDSPCDAIHWSSGTGAPWFHSGAWSGYLATQNYVLSAMQNGWGLSHNTNNPGFVELPGGWYLMAGIASYASSDGTNGTFISLPTNFPNAGVATMCIDTGANANKIAVVSVAANGFNVVCRDSGTNALANTAFRYIAIGY